MSLGAGVLALASVACHRPLGRLTYIETYSEAEQRDLRYGVYRPPGWDGRTPLPLVVLLHGRGDDETSADRASMMSAFDDGIRSGQIPPFIMVAPEGEVGFWANWHDGTFHWRDWVLEEVIPAVRAQHPIVSGSEGLHLVGVSMGGGGGMQMWLSDPGRFASATILSAPIMNEEDSRRLLRRFTSDRIVARVFGPPGAGGGHDPYTTLVEPSDFEGSRLMFGAASRDIPVMLESNRRFRTHLTEAGLPHDYIEFPGGHGWKAWSIAIPYALCVHLQSNCAMASPLSPS